MLTLQKKPAPKVLDLDVDITPIRAPAAYPPRRLSTKSAVLLGLAGLAPTIGFGLALFYGHNTDDVLRMVGPSLLVAWPLFLALGAKLWVRTLTAERNKTAAEWRQPLIAARSRIAALEVVARARYSRPEGWPDQWPSDRIS